ncbi:MAG: cohesin domain-containing protein [bacterium]
MGRWDTILVAVILLSIGALSAGGEVSLSVDPATSIAKPDSHAVVCIDFGGVSPEMAITLVQFTLSFDTCVVFWDSTITFDATCLDSLGWHIQVHNESYTDLQVWMTGGQIMDCDGCGLRIGFVVNGDCVQACGGDSALLHLSDVVINEGLPAAIPNDGLVIVNRGPYFTSPEDGTQFHLKEGPDEGCDTLCSTITAVDPDGDSLHIQWLADDSTSANGATLDTLGPGMWQFCWAPPKRVGNSLAGACYSDTFVVYSTCGAGGLGSPSCCFDTIVVSSCVDSLHLHAFWPDTTDYHACGRVEIPVYLETNYGLCFEDLDIMSIYLELNYDTEHLNVFEVGNEGLVTEHLGPLTYSVNGDLGSIIVSLAFNSKLTGCAMPAPIVYVGFERAGGAQAGNLLELSIDHVKINEAYPRVCWEGGSLHVINYSIEGNLFYSDNGEPVPGAEVKMWVNDSTMTPPADDTVYTDPNGHYGISPILGCSDYCVKVQMDPIDVPDSTQVITSLDAAYILLHVDGTWPFSRNDSLAADVTGTGEITPSDAAQLLREIVGHETGWPIGEWIFEPLYRCYANLSASRTGEDYEGVIIGDVTQNWPNISGPKVGTVADPDVIPEDRVREQEEEEYFTFPITFENADGIIAAEFRLTYHPEILTAVEVRTTELSAGFYLEYKIDPGEIRVAMAGDSPMSGSGAIVEIEFKTKSGETDLEIYIKINEQLWWETAPLNMPYIRTTPTPSIRLQISDTRYRTRDTRCQRREARNPSMPP